MENKKYIFCSKKAAEYLMYETKSIQEVQKGRIRVTFFFFKAGVNVSKNMTRH